MYNTGKKILNALLGRKTIFRMEPALRRLYALAWSGSRHQCTICHKKLKAFVTLPHGDLLCPNCGSLARDRRLWQLLESRFLAGTPRVLDFSPSRPLYRKMKSLAGISYIASDLSGNFIAENQYDITAIPIADEAFNLVICYHVLEHIEDDAKAMNELYRIIQPGGKAIIQTPYKEGPIYEDPAITYPQQREVHFGQDDHVRIYSISGLKERLAAAGFHINSCRFDENTYHGLSANETILIANKL